MPFINKLDNTAQVVFNGVTVLSNTVETTLNLNPLITKAVDKLTANIGDTLLYTCTVTNPNSLNTLTNVAFSDILPAGCSYVVDSFKVDGVAATPTVAGNTISYNIASMSVLQVKLITFQVTVTG